MAKIQFSALLRRPLVLLTLILAAFLCRETFLITVFPMFTGQDEARHYNTIQWLAEGRDPICNDQANDENQDKKDLGTYRFSEEIRKTSDAANLSVWRSENYHKPEFITGNQGSNESLIQEQNWSRITSTCPPDIAANARHFSLFHFSGSLVEQAWENTDIMTRFYLIRLMAVLLGTLTILFAYLATIEAGFSSRVSLLIALILSLQPKLSTYTTNINYDSLLIPLFALFLLAGLRCLRRGLTTTNIVLLTVAFGGSILTKGTGLVLLAGLSCLVVILLRQQQFWNNITIRQWLTVGILSLGFLIIINSIYPLSNLFPNINPTSLLNYLEKGLPKIPSSSQNFWGVMSWTRASHGHWFVWIIWAIEAMAIYGLFRYFRTKTTPIFLPSKPATLFLVTLFVALQLGVRFHDWHVFQETGSLALGTPGRYFLPTLLPQLLLMAIGIGTLLKRSLFLERSLLLFAALILAFHLYTTWLIIIPRFYL